MECVLMDVDVEMDGPIWLKVGTTNDGQSPERVMRWFADANLLACWWGEEHVIEPVPGGRYEVRWPSRGRTMRGEVIRCGERELVYSWGWRHEPNIPTRAVLVRTIPTASRDGTRLTIVHGPYRRSAPKLRQEDGDRNDHRDGWLYFIPKLREAIATASASLTGASIAP